MVSLLDFTKSLKEIKSYKKFFQGKVKTAIHHTSYETNVTLTPKPINTTQGKKIRDKYS